MTKQEVFDIVVTHLWSMKERSMLKTFCAYRGKNGSKCAVGILIPDDVYYPSLEGSNVIKFIYNRNKKIFEWFKPLAAEAGMVDMLLDLLTKDSRFA